MIEDSPVVSEIRQIRREISKRFGHDPDRYIDYLRSLEQANQPNKSETTGNVVSSKVVEKTLGATGQI